MNIDCSEDSQLARRLGRMSDKICNLILFSDLPEIDIELKIARMREVVEQRQPERLELFEHIYQNRFQRLWRQWRSPL